MFSAVQNFFARGNLGPLGDASRAAAAYAANAPTMTFAERKEMIAILCAGNTLAVALLVGVLVLQIGEWYVEETVVKPTLEAEQVFLRGEAAKKKDL